MQSDTITLLHAHGRNLAKRIWPNGSIEDYDRAYQFDLDDLTVRDLADLRELLRDLLYLPDYAVVRAAIADPGRTRDVRRLLYPDPNTGDAASLLDVPRRWLALDIDDDDPAENARPSNLERCAELVIGRLPSSFWDRACIVQASAGHGIKPGIRLRLWFWLSRPVGATELKRWLRDTPADPSVFNAVQPIYTAAPIFVGGGADHLPRRLVFLPGRRWVDVPEPAPPDPAPEPCPKPPASPSWQGSARGAVYLRAALYSAVQRILGADRRHPAILTEARGLARLVHAGMLDLAVMERVLRDAAYGAGKHDEAEITRIINFAMAHPSDARLPGVGR